MPGLTIINPGLIGALTGAAAGNITFVGSATGSATTTSTSTTFSFSSISVQANDVAIVAYASSILSDIDISATGYTEVADLYGDDNIDTNLWVGIKKLTSNSDNSITITHGGTDANRGSAYIAYVWRGVNQTTLQDTTATTIAEANTGLPDPPSITPVTSGAIILAIGAGVATASITFGNPSSTYNNFVTVTGVGSSAAIALALGSYNWTSGAYDPPEFIYASGTDNTFRSSAAVTMALRPA